jgi:hypothetical protein
MVMFMWRLTSSKRTAKVSAGIHACPCVVAAMFAVGVSPGFAVMPKILA